MWKALVDETTHWWRKDYYTNPNTKRFVMEAKLGGKVFEDWGDGAGVMWYTIVGIDPPRSMRLAGYLFPEYGGPASCLLHITLEAKGKGTLFKLTDNQAEAILNMRLRNLRKLEEMEIKGEHADLKKEQKELQALLKSDDAQWKKIADELRETRKIFDPKSAVGKRRTTVEDAPAAEAIDLDQLIEKEPVTVILSEKGWIRTMKGHVVDRSDIKYKDGDEEAFIIPAMTTDRLMLFGTDGKFYTLEINNLPGGRGHGEPIRLLIDLGNDRTAAAAFLHQPGRRLLVASTTGHGFIVKEEDCLSSTRKGKQVLNVADGAEASVCRPADGDMVASVGDNKKFLVFPLDELPEMARGKGVAIQKFQSGGLSDTKVFAKKEGLTWIDRSGRLQTIDDWKAYAGKRAQSGRIAPKGFPSNKKFGAWG